MFIMIKNQYKNLLKKFQEDLKSNSLFTKFIFQNEFFLEDILSLNDDDIKNTGFDSGKDYAFQKYAFENLYFGYQKIETLIPQFFNEKEIEQFKILKKFKIQTNSVAKGYLMGYIDYLYSESEVMIEYRKKYMSDAEFSIVNKPLIWIINIFKFIFAEGSVPLPEMSTALCGLTTLIEDNEDLKVDNKQQLLELHAYQHDIGNNFLFFIDAKNYSMAIFILSRLYGVTLDLSNRLNLARQLNTIKELQKDALTGFYLRHDMDQKLEEALEKAKKHQQPISIMMLDLDHFKKINDQFGHQQGDEVLKQTSVFIKEALRASDKVFRYGGEEFLVLLEGADCHISFKIAERIRISVEQHDYLVGNNVIGVTISIGVYSPLCESLETAIETKQMIERCDELLYQAKKSGRNQVKATNSKS